MGPFDQSVNIIIMVILVAVGLVIIKAFINCYTTNDGHQVPQSSNQYIIKDSNAQTSYKDTSSNKDTGQQFEGTHIQQVVLIGFGAVQKALWTLIQQIEPVLFVKWPVVIIEPLDLSKSEIYAQMLKYNKRVTHIKTLMTEDNYRDIFKDTVSNALVIDLAYRTDTKSIVEQCQIYNCLYINTALDVWPSGDQQYRSIFHIKQDIINHIQGKVKGPINTCILNFGANPGLISHFVKYSLMQLYDQYLQTKPAHQQSIPNIQQDQQLAVMNSVRSIGTSVIDTALLKYRPVVPVIERVNNTSDSINFKEGKGLDSNSQDIESISKTTIQRASNGSIQQNSKGGNNNETRLSSDNSNIENRSDDYSQYPFSQIAQQLGLTLIQVAERDTSLSNIQAIETTIQRAANSSTTQSLKGDNKFNLTNTWSVVGFLDEALDRAQISLGTHEILPNTIDTVELDKSGQMIINAPAIELKTKSFEPEGGELVGFNIPHAECYSLVELLRQNNTYRPSCYYVYQPCNNCKVMAYYAPNINKAEVGVTCINNKAQMNEYPYIDNNKKQQYIDNSKCNITDNVLRKDQILSGFDSLGALMYFRQPLNSTFDNESRGQMNALSDRDLFTASKDDTIPNKDYKLQILWTGTTLDNSQINNFGNEVNATTVQVAIGTLSAIIWMLKPGNNARGIIDPEVLPTEQIINYCKPYLGTFRVNYNCEEFQPNTDIYRDLLVQGASLFK